jgi:hypothetical protein
MSTVVPERSIEMMLTFVIKVSEPELAQAQLDDFEDWLDTCAHNWFLNRCSQKDGRKVTLRFDYKRPPNV